MLFYLLYPRINVVQYITFRTAAAGLTAFLISLLLGPWMIRTLREFQIGQVVRDELSTPHQLKAGTPTMGGLLILAATLLPTLLWSDLTNAYIWVAMLSTVAFGLVGFLDDYLKIGRQTHSGLQPLYKLLGQCVVGAGVGFALLWMSGKGLYSTELFFPFFKQLTPDLGWFYVPFAVVLLAASSNAVNLTDGLDGLAISIFTVAAAAVTALAYVTGHAIFADYLLLAHVTPAAEVTIFCGSLVGAGLGFLWYNSYPAQLFMGDVGSLALGGALGTMALLIKQELLLPIVGAVFAIELLSVVVQVGAFKLTGRRVFRMAPIHHHCELIGGSEPKVISRFLIAAVVFACFSLATLKLR